MRVVKDLSELVKSDVISEEIANKIRDYCQKIEGPSHFSSFLLFLYLTY